jgi:uncharacterized protein (DUF305 family)
MNSTKSKYILAAICAVTLVAVITFFSVTRTEVNGDRAFIEEMIPHHEEAISSSKAILKVAEDPDVRRIAEAVIEAQQVEVSQMNSWFIEWFGQQYRPTGVYKSMMSSIDGLSVREAEAKYTFEMISHHEHAVLMARELQSTTTRPELKTLAKNVIASQEKEIEELKILLEKYGDAPAVIDHSSH